MALQIVPTAGRKYSKGRTGGLSYLIGDVDGEGRHGGPNELIKCEVMGDDMSIMYSTLNYSSQHGTRSTPYAKAIFAHDPADVMKVILVSVEIPDEQGKATYSVDANQMQTESALGLTQLRGGGSNKTNLLQDSREENNSAEELRVKVFSAVIDEARSFRSIQLESEQGSGVINV